MKQLILCLPLLVASPALAQDPGTRGSAALAIAADLGISEAQLKACFKANKPSREERQALRAAREAGGAPNPERRAAFLSCLQQHNSQISADSLQQALQKHRPARD